MKKNCIRSYLAKILDITNGKARACLQTLQRYDCLSIGHEILPEDEQDAAKGMTVRFPREVLDIWETPHLVQLYIYMMCAAEHEENYIVGSGYRAVHVSPGDMLLKHATILEKLRCKEWQLRKNLRYLEDHGAIEKLFRIGNRGFLVHLNHYPETPPLVWY